MVSVGGSNHGRRRSLDAEINLVPFIDLLSMCICFLLMTAIWIQIGALPIKQSHGTDAAVDAPRMEMEVHLVERGAVKLVVKSKGKTGKQLLIRETSPEILVSKLEQGLDSFLAGATGAPVARAAEAIGSATVTASSKVPYGDMVSVMDLLRRHRIVNLGVQSQGAGV